MRSSPSSLLVLGCLLLGACGPGNTTPDTSASDGGPRDGGAPIDAPEGTDAPGSDAPIALSDGGAADAPSACEPTGGPAMGGAYCDTLELALITGEGVPPRAVLRGRFRPDDLDEGGCFRVDSVDVTVDDTTVATLPGASGRSRGDGTVVLAEGPAFDELMERCESDDRFEGFGLLVRGVRDGGTFVGECADAEGGSRWPPALRVTCHHNVDVPPFSSSALHQFGFVTLDAMVPHDAGEAITSMDPDVHVIPYAYAPFGGPPPVMVDPFDATGWMASIVEASSPEGPISQLHVIAGAGFPMDLCADGSTTSPPVFLVGISGGSERGPYATEVYVSYCAQL